MDRCDVQAQGFASAHRTTTGEQCIQRAVRFCGFPQNRFHFATPLRSVPALAESLETATGELAEHTSTFWRICHLGVLENILASTVLFRSSFELKRLRIPNCGMGVARSLDEGELLSEGCGPFRRAHGMLMFGVSTVMTIQATFVDPKDSAKENHAAKR